MSRIGGHRHLGMLPKPYAAGDVASAPGGDSSYLRRRHPRRLGRPQGPRREAGQPTNLAAGGAKGTATQRAEAEAFAAKVLPVVHAIEAEGAMTLGAIAAASNARGVRTARGNEWHDSTVRNLLARSIAP
jgi:hypothetical protein